MNGPLYLFFVVLLGMVSLSLVLGHRVTHLEERIENLELMLTIPESYDEPALEEMDLELPQEWCMRPPEEFT